MKFESTLSCGDKGWTFNGQHVVQRTVGQIRIEFTQSPGIGDGYMLGGVATYTGGDCGQVADNYAPMPPKLIEQYMCVETGIGSGTVYTLGESIFASEDECRAACAEAIRDEEKRKASVKKYERERDTLRQAQLRRELALLDERLATPEAA